MNNPNEDLNAKMMEILGLSNPKNNSDSLVENNIQNKLKENDTMAKFTAPAGLNVNIKTTKENTVPTAPTIPTIPQVPQATANVVIGQDVQGASQIPQTQVVNSVPIVNIPMPTIPVAQQDNIVEDDEPEDNNPLANQQFIMVMPQVIIEEKEKKVKVSQVESLDYDAIHANLMANYKTMTNEEKFRNVLYLASKGSKRVKTPGTVAAYIGKSVNSRRVTNAVNGKPMNGYNTQKAIEFFWTNESLVKNYPDVLQAVVQLDLFSWKNPEQKQ